MASDDPQIETRTIPVVWVGNDDTPVTFVNAFLTQANQGEFFVTLGQLVPPAILPGTPEEIKAQVDAVSFIQSRTVARIGMNEERARELVNNLQTTLDNHDKTKEEA